MDSGLTKLGKRQAVKLSKNFMMRKECWDHIYVSPLSRAKETADIALSYTDSLKQKIILVEALKELDTGEYSTFTFDLLSKKDEELFNMNFNNKIKYPGGESLHDMYSRVTYWFIETILKEENIDKKILIVSHTGSISSIFHYLFDVDLNKYHPIELQNCNPVILNLRYFDNIFIPRIISINGYLRITNC